MEFNRKDIRPLFDDEYVGEPAKRALQYIHKRREVGSPVVGVYCGYAPLEVIKAMDCTVAVLCAFSNKTVSVAEGILPGNLCPLIKSSYGFILTDTCPFFGLSDVVVAETTCDGKKKMYELIRDIKPMHVMDLPHLPDEEEAEANWTSMIRKLQVFLERYLGRHAADEAIEVQIREANRRNRKMNRIFDFAARTPPVMNWQELYDLTFLAQPAAAPDLDPILDRLLADLEKRVEEGVFYGSQGAPRVLITGCPVAGDATKVYRAIEEAGGVIVAIDSCTGMKPYADEIGEDTPDPVAALAKRYLKIPCACMTPNMRRLSELDRYIERFKPDAVVDVILHACHGYNVESYKVMQHVRQRNLPFLQIETDYSMTDTGQLRTRVQALLETASQGI
jgi:benzoyl-CoA reductase/2-hydroxyglutaryl-CoA dehydratase subunit BcrC/BadD/HgdB